MSFLKFMNFATTTSGASCWVKQHRCPHCNQQKKIYFKAANACGGPVFSGKNNPTPLMKISENCSPCKPRGMHPSLCLRLLSGEKHSHMVTKGKINNNAGLFSNNAGVIGLSESVLLRLSRSWQATRKEFYGPQVYPKCESIVSS